MYRLFFRIHAIQRMFQREISIEDVKHALATGETIEEYPDDTPYPSRLVLGWRGGRPLHLVIADNKESEEKVLVTVYEPSADAWEKDFKRRKTK
ncbi:DUF4258 domain-containing protein [bacterium]|nr:MAG: DUF4258 domain-containing protein [bacterium]